MAPLSASELQVRADALGVELLPLHLNFGVQVTGLDLTQELTEEQQRLVLDIWRTHELLLFRGQELSPRDQERLLLLFPHDAQAIKEERFNNKFFTARVPGHPLLVVRFSCVDMDEYMGVPREELQKTYGGPPFDRSRLWHMDLSDEATPPQVSALYMVIPPQGGGGETLFASTSVGFDKLDDATREQLLGLTTVNASKTDVVGKTQLTSDGLRRLDDLEESIAVAKQYGIYKEQHRPLIIQDTETGRRSLLSSPMRLHHFEPGMRREESLELLHRVTSAMTAPSEVFELKWQPHDFAIWANRRVLHSSTPSNAYKDKARLLHLVFLDCDQPLVAARDCPPVET